MTAPTCIHRFMRRLSKNWMHTEIQVVIVIRYAAVARVEKRKRELCILPTMGTVITANCLVVD